MDSEDLDEILNSPLIIDPDSVRSTPVMLSQSTPLTFLRPPSLMVVNSTTSITTDSGMSDWATDFSSPIRMEPAMSLFQTSDSLPPLNFDCVFDPDPFGKPTESFGSLSTSTAPVTSFFDRSYHNASQTPLLNFDDESSSIGFDKFDEPAGSHEHLQISNQPHVASQFVALRSSNSVATYPIVKRIQRYHLPRRAQLFINLPPIVLTASVIPTSISNLYQLIRATLTDYAFVHAFSAQLCKDLLPMDTYVTLKQSLLLSILSAQVIFPLQNIRIESAFIMFLILFSFIRTRTESPEQRCGADVNIGGGYRPFIGGANYAANGVASAEVLQFPLRPTSSDHR